jgi:hypothetical protein
MLPLQYGQDGSGGQGWNTGSSDIAVTGSGSGSACAGRLFIVIALAGLPDM